MDRPFCPDCLKDFWWVSEELADRLTHGAASVASGDLKKRPRPDADEIASFFASLELQESNRAIPVLAFSYLEEHLRMALVQNLQPLSGSLEKELFDYTGPLGTASAQIAVARALGWLSEQTTTEMHRLRKVRNHFSHSPEASFEDDMVTGHLREHSQAEIVKTMTARIGEMDPDEIYMPRVGRNIQESPAFDARLRFVIAAFVTSRRALMELALFPILNRWSLTLDSVMDADAHPESSVLRGWTGGIAEGIGSIMNASQERLTLIDGGPAIDQTVGQLPGSADD